MQILSGNTADVSFPSHNTVGGFALHRRIDLYAVR